MIELKPNLVIVSLGGVLSAPFEFLLSEMEQFFPKDLDRAEGDREIIWRREIYKSLEVGDLSRFKFINNGVKLHENKLTLTDIDAVIFDKQTGTLGLFQLKWHVIFARNMRKRSSKIKNFVEKSAIWVNKVTLWLQSRSAKEVMTQLGFTKSDSVNYKNTYLFVLGRYYAHFSGQPRPSPDAAWGTWGQFIELIPSRTDSTYNEFLSNPIAWIHTALQNDSPYNYIDTNPLLEESRILGLTVIVEVPKPVNPHLKWK